MRFKPKRVCLNLPYEAIRTIVFKLYFEASFTIAFYNTGQDSLSASCIFFLLIAILVRLNKIIILPKLHLLISLAMVCVCGICIAVVCICGICIAMVCTCDICLCIWMDLFFDGNAYGWIYKCFCCQNGRTWYFQRLNLFYGVSTSICNTKSTRFILSIMSWTMVCLFISTFFTLWITLVKCT